MNFLFSVIIGPLLALNIPGNLQGGDQERALEILGLSNSTKFLSQAYPLGGHSGFEISLGVESIDISELSQIGSAVTNDNNLILPNLTLGKGIYNDMEIFIHFLPSTLGISKFGGSFRWSFLKLLFLPINLALVVRADSSNIKNLLITRNLGADLMAGLSLGEFSFFAGGGYANSRGIFYGGPSGITASGENENLKVNSIHYMMGATYNFDPFFIGLSIDRYQDVVYTFKSGFIF